MRPGKLNQRHLAENHTTPGSFPWCPSGLVGCIQIAFKVFKVPLEVVKVILTSMEVKLSLCLPKPSWILNSRHFSSNLVISRHFSSFLVISRPTRSDEVWRGVTWGGTSLYQTVNQRLVIFDNIKIHSNTKFFIRIILLRASPGQFRGQFWTFPLSLKH